MVMDQSENLPRDDEQPAAPPPVFTPEPGPETFPFEPAVRESDATEPVARSADERTCVICHTAFDASSLMRCESRPDFCALCCPHPLCHDRAESC